MIENMAKSETWTLRTWKSTIETQLSSWMMYVPGMSSSDEVKLAKNFKVILDKMKDEELDDHTLIKAASRDRIVNETNESAETISKLLVYFKQTLILASWLRLKLVEFVILTSPFRSLLKISCRLNEGD
jgi:signal recognition particle GTPase